MVLTFTKINDEFWHKITALVVTIEFQAAVNGFPSRQSDYFFASLGGQYVYYVIEMCVDMWKRIKNGKIWLSWGGQNMTLVPRVATSDGTKTRLNEKTYDDAVSELGKYTHT